MRSRRLTHWNLEILSQRMATYAATSIVFRILALLFSSKCVMQKGQTALCKNMQDCESNFARFRVLLRVRLVERRSADIARTKKSLVKRRAIDVYGRCPAQRSHGILLLSRLNWCLRAYPRTKDSWLFTLLKMIERSEGWTAWLCAVARGDVWPSDLAEGCGMWIFVWEIAR